MSMKSLETTYTSFAIKNNLTFAEGKGNLPFIEIENEYATALISIYGAQVLSYKPKQSEKEKSFHTDLLFVSEKAYFEQGKAIKGGIPICWPWFGRGPDSLGRQMHGFARNMLWQLEETSSKNSGETEVVLSLAPTAETHKLWPHDFKLMLTVTVGQTLKLSLQTMNIGSNAFSITQALHSYFSVQDVDQVQVNGLDNVEYIDTVGGTFKNKLQEGEITVNQELDRIYTNAPVQSTLIDKKLGREIKIDSKGSKTTVVWNPWVDLSNKSADLEDDAYKRFICIETANAAEDVIVIEPNDAFTLEAEYSISSIE